MTEQGTIPEEIQAIPRWLDELRPGGEGLGFIEKNLRHSLMFVKRPSTRLLVTFDNLSNVNDSRHEREPWAFKFAQDNGLSHLGIMAHVSDWYRDADLIARFERLVAEGFFNNYERVVFAGVSMGGFAAIAFGSLVEGAHVVAVNPQSTLDTELVPWETRYENGRRQDWTLPLSDAAALTGKLERVNIFYDPYHELDQKHIDRFSGDNVRVFNCWFSAHKTAVFLRKIDALKAVMQHCIFDELTGPVFYGLYRARRNLPWYRGAIAAYFEGKGRTEIAEGFNKQFRARLRRKIKSGEVVRGGATTETEDDSPSAADEEVETTAAPAPKAGKPDRKAPPKAEEHKLRHDPSAEPEHDTRIVAPEGGGKTAPGQIDRDSMGSRLIVTTMKNEGPFMLEWVAFNRAIGFTDFLIYTNNCDDGTDAIAERLQEMGLAQHRDNQFRKGGSPQRTALKNAQKEPVYQNADWLICADCDEFLNIRVGEGRLDDLFAAVGNADAISLCWKLFGNSGHVTYTRDLITERFDRSAGEHEYPNYRARGMKTLVRNNERFFKLRIHRPAFHLDKGDVKWVDAGGKPMPSPYLDGGWKSHAEFSHDYARLHHYAVRSVESFLVKRDRGRTNHVNDDQGITYWSNMNFNSERDVSIHARLPALRRELATLMEDPELARLHDAACDWHQGKIEELLKREGWPAFRDQIIEINKAPELEES